jgi:tRNA A-37 threonylcarbamoyl transferase component Bud32
MSYLMNNLHALHSMGIGHGDIHMGNVIVDKERRPKFIHF